MGLLLLPFFIIIILGTACVCVARMSHTAVDLFQDIDFYFMSRFVYLLIRVAGPPAFPHYEALGLFSQTWDEWIFYSPSEFNVECCLILERHRFTALRNVSRLTVQDFFFFFFFFVPEKIEWWASVNISGSESSSFSVQVEITEMI
jgi:hypothetical protein